MNDERTTKLYTTCGGQLIFRRVSSVSCMPKPKVEGNIQNEWMIELQKATSQLLMLT